MGTPRGAPPGGQLHRRLTCSVTISGSRHAHCFAVDIELDPIPRVVHVSYCQHDVALTDRRGDPPRGLPYKARILGVLIDVVPCCSPRHLVSPSPAIGVAATGALCAFGAGHGQSKQAGLTNSIWQFERSSTLISTPRTQPSTERDMRSGPADLAATGAPMLLVDSVCSGPPPAAAVAHSTVYLTDSKEVAERLCQCLMRLPSRAKPRPKWDRKKKVPLTRDSRTSAARSWRHRTNHPRSRKRSRSFGENIYAEPPGRACRSTQCMLAERRGSRETRRSGPDRQS